MTETPGPLDRAEFDRLVRDALANLYDQAALQTHPLAAYFPQPGGHRSRAEQLRAALVAAVEGLRPSKGEPQPGSSEWRPYLLLNGRYIEGENLVDLQAHLSLSERQLRREQNRALQAVAARLWDQVQLPPAGTAKEPEEGGSANGFTITPGPLDPAELLAGVAATLRRRAESEGTILEVQPGEPGTRVVSDRVIVRQILVSLLGYAMDLREDGPVVLATHAGPLRQVRFEIRFRPEDPGILRGDNGARAMDYARGWAGRLGARLALEPVPGEPGAACLALSLPPADQPVLLVVDDQETAVRMFQRYLSQTGLRVVGVSDSSQALATARRLQPRAIALDVMMPHMDGWEVLQALQADPSTQHIPVIICSVWEEPELASSLGAADFLKKPITQKDLLAALVRIHLLETSGG